MTDGPKRGGRPLPVAGREIDRRQALKVMAIAAAAPTLSLAVLCDVIIPADERSSSASQVGAHDFIDEWVSAPYDANRSDQVIVRGGLTWLDRESAERYGEGLRFRDLTLDQKHGICDDICFLPNAAPGYEAGARFFDRVRDLTSTAFWTTDAGMRDLEYIGNVPLPRWEPPPPEVLRHIGVQ